MKRVFLIVLDSVGIGNAPDAAKFGDDGADTMKSISKSSKFHIPNLIKMGLGNIDGLSYLNAEKNFTASVARLCEKSMGKDTTIGHLEIAGIISENPLPTYPNGFPKEIIDEFSKRTGKGVLCNKPYSGTEVIKDYGEEHLRTGDLIVYTSADSVFQIAAHEDIVPVEKLYEYCKIAREILTGENGVGRVIARPFEGEYPFKRTANRHDFSILPPSDTMLDKLKRSGFDTIAVGKINDIFAGQGISEYSFTKGNADGMAKTDEYVLKDFNGLCFVNLVDFDMLYGHRRNIDGYAAALSEFDKWLGEFINKLRPDDILMITADHGCDPGFLKTTDHTRECVPLIIYGKNVKPKNLGTFPTYSVIAKTVCDYFGVEFDTLGKSVLKDLL